MAEHHLHGSQSNERSNLHQSSPLSSPSSTRKLDGVRKELEVLGLGMKDVEEVLDIVTKKLNRAAPPPNKIHHTYSSSSLPESKPHRVNHFFKD